MIAADGEPPRPALPALLVDRLVGAALREDLGQAGDITTDACVAPDVHGRAMLAARVGGTIAGLDLAAASFRLIDDRIRFAPAVRDGDAVAAGAVIAELSGPARGILTGERVALNFLGHLCGIATATRGIVDAVAHTPCRVACTRKTTPGLRAVEKYAVRCGGGMNHRFGLDDAILIKDNHIALAGGIGAALARARARAGHLVKIEIEVDTLDQLAEVFAAGGADAILLDNMKADLLREAVALVARRATTEASGGITAANAAEIAATGVDIISLGWLTHSVRSLDIGLDI
jgi:nicotinate-nucleotide pyrophosphorylase (carboxylating)